MYKYSFNYDGGIIVRSKNNKEEYVCRKNLKWEVVTLVDSNEFDIGMELPYVSEEEALKQAIKLGMKKEDFFAQ